MKFANYYFKGKSMNNIGDNMQILAIDYIYQQMGVQDDIVYIDKNDLPTYEGEYVVLPVNMPLVDYRENGIAGWFSSKIIPVFFGLTLVKDSLLPEEVVYYKRFEPIGCRDERTLNTLRTYGIFAYLNGCITAALPLRKPNAAKQNKVFLVDVPESLKLFIPDELKKDAVEMTHLYYDELEDPKQKMKDVYRQYREEARLVVTSLLHCAVPCMAAGIPVILAKEKCSYRLGWLEKLLPIYTLEEFPEIQWDPAPNYYEEQKRKILNIVIDRLKKTYEKYHEICELSDFYESRNKKEYVIDAFDSIQQYIDTHWSDREKAYHYSIWGLTQTSSLTVSYISKNYPNAKLCHVYDKYKKVKFEGLQAQHPSQIEKYPQETVFITTVSAIEEAQAFFKSIGRSLENVAFLYIIK